MRGFNHILRLWTAAMARVQDQIGASMVEYSIMLAGIAITVVAGLALLGIGIGGAYSVDGILDRGGLAFQCKDGGWASILHPGTDPEEYFKNQGDCMQYVQTGK
jgi:Flp pilus assembly pilin Flp